MAHVLLIDDDAPLRNVLTLALRKLQHQVTEAADGREGLRLFQQGSVDVIVTDIVMPDEDGIGLLMKLRTLARGTPVIAMSGGLDRSGFYRDLATKFGAAQVLAKPFTIAALDTAIKNVLATPRS